RRRAREPRDLPRRTRAPSGEPEAGHRDEQSGRGGDRDEPPAEGPSARGRRELRGWTFGAQRGEDTLEALHRRVGLARAVPEVLVAHDAASLPSLSRSISIPRWRFTRTDP